MGQEGVLIKLYKVCQGQDSYRSVYKEGDIQFTEEEARFGSERTSTHKSINVQEYTYKMDVKASKGKYVNLKVNKGTCIN